MAVDLSDLMEPAPPRKRRAKSTFTLDSSVAAAVDKSAVLAMVEQIEADEFLNEDRSEQQQKHQALNVAHDEDVSNWMRALAQQMQQHQSEAVSLLFLQQALEMPLVEVWLGLLLGGQNKYEWEPGDNFYREASEIWLSSFCAQTAKATSAAFCAGATYP